MASDTGVSSSDRITKTTKPYLVGTAEINASVRLFDGTVATGTAGIAAPDGAYTAYASTTLANGAHTFSAKATDVAGNISVSSTSSVVTVDTVVPSVTVNQAAGQADPTTTGPIAFTATFSDQVVGFINTDVTYSGSAPATTAVLSGTGPVYDILASGMTKSGTVTAAIAASKATDIAGNLNVASTATDNTVTYTDNTVTYTDNVAPAVTIGAFAAEAGQRVTVSGSASTGLGDLSVTVVLCTVNAFPCTAPNTKATLSGVNVDPGTGAWTVTSAGLSTTPVLYAQATQSDLTGNSGTSAISGPLGIP